MNNIPKWITFLFTETQRKGNKMGTQKDYFAEFHANSRERFGLLGP